MPELVIDPIITSAIVAIVAAALTCSIVALMLFSHATAAAAKFEGMYRGHSFHRRGARLVSRSRNRTNSRTTAFQWQRSRKR